MARCWTCGSPTGDLVYECPACKSVKELEVFKNQTAKNFDELAEIQERGFRELSEKVSTGLSDIASAIQWGFEELNWQLAQQTDILNSIENMIKTPIQTQASEWRQMAEELRRRGVLDQAENFFSKALENNPLDFRTYVGLAQTYIQMNRLNEARKLLERSLPHAPKEEWENIPIGMEFYGSTILHLAKGNRDGAFEVLSHHCRGGDDKPIDKQTKALVTNLTGSCPSSYYDFHYMESIERQMKHHGLSNYQSYSYRLIGHVYACEEDYERVAKCLRSSIELSPYYAEGYYDYAQCTAQTGDEEACLSSLRKAVYLNPAFYHLASVERNFEPLKGKVQNLLDEIIRNASANVKQIIAAPEDGIDKKLEEAKALVRKAKQSLEKSGVDESLESIKLYKNTKSKVELIKVQMQSMDYSGLLEAESAVLQMRNTGTQAIVEKANWECEHYEQALKVKKEAKKKEASAIIFWLLVFAVVGFCLGAFVGLGLGHVWVGGIIGAGIMIGLAFLIYLVWSKL